MTNAPAAPKGATSETIEAKTITPKQLAAYYETTVSTVLSWHHKGLIPAAVAVGRIYRFDLEAVKAALAANSKTAAR